MTHACTCIGIDAFCVCVLLHLRVSVIVYSLKFSIILYFHARVFPEDTWITQCNHVLTAEGPEGQGPVVEHELEERIEFDCASTTLVNTSISALFVFSSLPWRGFMLSQRWQ